MEWVTDVLPTTTLPPFSLSETPDWTIITLLGCAYGVGMTGRRPI